MSEQEHETPESLVQRIEDLAGILQDSSVEELELAEDGTQIIIKRQSGEKAATSTPHAQPQSTQATAKTTPAQAEKADQSRAIVAPLTGVFYPSPSPGSPPFVNVGDTIQSEQVVALIEAMKVFNEIHADVAGRLTQVNVEGGLVVKKGDVLFRVDPF